MGSVPLRKKKSNNGRQTSQHGSAQKPGIDSQEKQQREGNKNEAECNERGSTLVSLYRIVVTKSLKCLKWHRRDDYVYNDDYKTTHKTTIALDKFSWLYTEIDTFLGNYRRH